MLTRTPRGKVALSSATSDLHSERRQRSSLARVLRYKNEGVVERISEDEKVPMEDARAIFQEALIFLWGCKNGGKHSPTPREDMGWHAFILFTMDYQKFCHKYFGRFIHHVPFTKAQKEAMSGPSCYGKPSDCKIGACSPPCKSDLRPSNTKRAKDAIAGGCKGGEQCCYDPHAN